MDTKTFQQEVQANTAVNAEALKQFLSDFQTHERELTKLRDDIEGTSAEDDQTSLVHKAPIVIAKYRATAKQWRKTREASGVTGR